MLFSKYLIVEIMSFSYNTKEITEICFELNKILRNLAINNEEIIKNACINQISVIK